MMSVEEMARAQGFHDGHRQASEALRAQIDAAYERGRDEAGGGLAPLLVGIFAGAAPTLLLCLLFL